ncbi:MAG: hypothetical protein LBT33_10110, partial [Spirochaetia bacterium]|nr:hypothetical protein [Spirochaetia bacterium]
METQALHPGFVSGNVDQLEFFHIVTYQNGVIVVCMVMVAIKGHFHGTQDISPFIGKTHIGDLFFIDRWFENLGLIRSDGSVVAGPAVVKENEPVPGPKF